MKIRQLKLIATALLGIMPCFAQAMSTFDISMTVKTYLNDTCNTPGLYGNVNGQKIRNFIDESINEKLTDQIESLKEQLNLCKEELLIQKQKAFPFLFALVGNTVCLGATLAACTGIAAFEISTITIPTSIAIPLLPQKDVITNDEYRDLLTVTCGSLAVGVISFGIKEALDRIYEKVQDQRRHIQAKNAPIQTKIDAIDEVLKYIKSEQRAAKKSV